ncbi:L,D-transpeptidase family protein [Neobacillus jeddahensis]|uniref:L,D-transpeptidase family protein n=1 Tax=Neobacillus jeddahensis TaxID=1461580 RepID=UPI0005AB5FC6|nr:L,D-transpeptidase family protein [Neobacillus jeddahensis]
MTNTAVEKIEEHDKRRVSSSKWYKNWKFISGIIIIIALLLAAISYYQATRFNAHIMINGTNVGKLTADQAIDKLKSTTLKNEVYVGTEQIFNGEDTKAEFTKQDLSSIKKLLKRQWTFFPSSKTKEYSLWPTSGDENRSETMKKQVEEKLTAMNKDLTAPKDAEARLEQGQIIVTKAVNGKQYDVANLVKAYQKHGYTSEIHLDANYILPVKEDSPIVKQEQQLLQELVQRTVDYKVQDQVYSLKGSELIKNAFVTKDMQVTIDAGDLKNKITEINDTQSTLDKNFSFKNHAGAVISVKGQGYGWALDVDKEASQLQKAFENGETSITASNTHGHGWKNEGYGFETTTNNGIGDTYAEVSIAEQRIWIYKNGQLVLTTNVVTGKHSTGEDTSPGVWYVLYKREKATLRGTHVGSGSYEVPVDYWAPFTNSGQGFHDASWRSNWKSNAYLNAGSGGCVNTPPSVMKTVYDNLSTYEPVVIY